MSVRDQSFYVPFSVEIFCSVEIYSAPGNYLSTKAFDFTTMKIARFLHTTD